MSKNVKSLEFDDLKVQQNLPLFIIFLFQYNNSHLESNIILRQLY